jgi:cephalosporin-C deacetylase-like acetyl esterase
MMHTKPSDFDAYWQHTRDALATYPMSPEMELLPLRSTDFATLYSVRLTSVGPYRLFGYLSIPKGKGPFPAIYYAPKYQSVLEIIPQGTANLQRSAYITFSLAARGQRQSDTPYAAMFPGLLTDGIQNAQTYIFRGIVADALRGLEFLCTRPELDPSRLVVFGNDMALITAALGQGATYAVSTPALFYQAAELAPQTQAYPLEELNDYGRMFPHHQTAVRQTLAYYDLQAFAPQVTSKTLIIAGAPGSLLDRQRLAPLVESLAGETTVYDSAQSSYRDGLYAESWMAEQCGIKDVNRILPAHWQG